MPDNSDDCLWAVLERAAGSTQLPGLLPFPEKSVVQRLDGGQVDIDSLGLGTTAQASLEVRRWLVKVVQAYRTDEQALRSSSCNPR